MIRRCGVILALWGLCIGALHGAPADEIRVTPVIADRTVAASFAAGAALGADVREVVQSGLLMTLTFVVELRRPSGTWWDRTVGTTTVSSSIKFDNLSGIYQVSLMQDDHVTWSKQTKDFTEAREWLTSFDRVVLATDAALEPNADYYIRVRMRTSPRRTFPLWPWGTDEATGRADFTFIR